MSPGLIKPLKELHSLLANSSYKLPLYPATLILATEVELFVNVPFPFYTLPTLLRMSYDRYIHGGFGPFSFGPLFKGKAGGLKFRVEVRESGIVVVIPGTQLIGYVCDIVPQHPLDTQSSRNRRSVSTGGQVAEGHSNYGILSSKFGHWLTSKSRLSTLDTGKGTLEAYRFRASAPLHHGTRTDSGEHSRYSQRLQEALLLAKTAPPFQPLEQLGMYSNLSAVIQPTVYQAKKEQSKKKTRFNLHNA